MNFHLPRLYPIVDSAALAALALSPLDFADTLLTAGVRILQFRHKSEWTEATFQQASRIADLCRSASASFVVNDRADFAVLLDAAVHVGQDDLPPAAVRQVVGPRAIGFSTHNRRQLTGGDAEDVQYLALGPIFETRSKQHASPALGLAGLASLASLTRKPLVAIGGITQHNAPDVIAAGAASIAVISALLPPDRNLQATARLAHDWLHALS